MSDRVTDRKYVWYVCGKCGHENYRLRTDEEDDCTECGAVYDSPDGETGAYVTNGDFEDWSLGGALAPDGFTLTGAGATVARESTIVHGDSYSAKVTRTGTDCYLTQSIHSSTGIGYWSGRTVKIGVYVYATVADRARLMVTDGVNTSYSDYHSGDSAWKYLSVDHAVAANATELTIRLQVNDGNTSAYFDDLCQNPASSGGRLVEIRRWEHRTKSPSDIPEKIKLDLNNPNG